VCVSQHSLTKKNVGKIETTDRNKPRKKKCNVAGGWWPEYIGELLGSGAVRVIYWPLLEETL
jgi:hypothetical protein